MDRRVSKRIGEKIERIDLRHGDLPDPISLAIQTLDERIRELEKRVLDSSSERKDTFEIFYGDYGAGI